MYMLGQYVGWRVLVLMHSKATIRKYERILNIVVRDEFPDEGAESDRSIAYKAANALSNFWKIVSGEAKLDLAKDERKVLAHKNREMAEHYVRARKGERVRPLQ
jgi:hypothetical protein